MARVFLSGTYEDRPALRRLAEALRRAGHESRMGDDLVHDLVIWTGDELVPGMGLSAALERALARSDALIIGYSAAAARRGFPRHDLDAFRKAGASKPVFVVRLDHTPLPSDLFDTVAFDLHRDSWNRDIEPLAAALAPSTPSFVDREAELAWLARHLRAGAPVAVVGEFGVGKTALVAEYVRRHAAEYPGGYRVIQADPDFERLVGEARSAQTERSLLVIEELDRHASSGIQHLSDGDPHTIVIARTPPVEFPGPVLEVAPLSHADALQLFELRTGPTDDPRESQKRDQIVTALGGMPRAIVLAADQYRRGSCG